jgi:hypothetical protein
MPIFLTINIAFELLLKLIRVIMLFSVYITNYSANSIITYQINKYIFVKLQMKFLYAICYFHHC